MHRLYPKAYRIKPQVKTREWWIRLNLETPLVEFEIKIIKQVFKKKEGKLYSEYSSLANEYKTFLKDKDVAGLWLIRARLNV